MKAGAWEKRVYKRNVKKDCGLVYFTSLSHTSSFFTIFKQRERLALFKATISTYINSKMSLESELVQVFNCAFFLRDRVPFSQGYVSDWHTCKVRIPSSSCYFVTSSTKAADNQPRGLDINRREFDTVWLILVLGMNSILVYVGHGILWRHFPFSWEMDEYGSHGEKLAMSMTGTALWVLIAYYLFTVNVFLKI